MDEHELEARLAQLNVPALQASEDRMASAARAVARGQSGADRAHRHRGWLAATAVALLVGIGITPPGQALGHDFARLLGLGGDPEVHQNDAVQGSALIVTTGRAEGGLQFEAIAKAVTSSTVDQSISSDIPPGLICFRIDWLESEHGATGGSCTRASSADRNQDASLDGIGLSPEPGGSGAGVLTATAEDPRIIDVRLESVQAGERRPLPSTFVRVTGDQLSRLGGNEPVGFLVAPLDAAEVSLASQGDIALRLTAFDGGGDTITTAEALPPDESGGSSRGTSRHPGFTPRPARGRPR